VLRAHPEPEPELELELEAELAVVPDAVQRQQRMSGVVLREVVAAAAAVR
jgi:hypothetical protein